MWRRTRCAQAVRYVEANPLRAGMVARAQDYRWSSCAVHGGLADDDAQLLSADRPFPGDRPGQQWLDWINSAMGEAELNLLRLNTSTGRPCGSGTFIADLVNRLGRILNRQKPGRKPKSVDTVTQDMFEDVP